jgi:hypothetical protein
MPKSRDNWSTLEPDQHVVYGVPEGKGLSLSPYFPPEDCLAAWRGQSEMLPDNTLRGRFSFEANGAPETRLRRALAGLHPADRGRLFDQSFQRLSPNARIKQVSCMDPVDFSGPIKVDAEYEATQYALGGDGQRYLALPLLQNVLGDRTLSDLFGQTSSQERKYGVKLWATRLARFEETVNLPPDWKVTKLPDPVELDGPAAALKFRAEAQPGRIHYTCDLVVKKWLIPAREYGNYKEVIEKFEELTGRVVRIELEGAHAQR